MEFQVRGSNINGYTVFLWDGEGKNRLTGFLFKGTKTAKFKTVQQAEDAANRAVSGKKTKYSFLLQ